MTLPWWHSPPGRSTSHTYSGQRTWAIASHIVQGPAVNSPENRLISWEPLYLWHCQEAAHGSFSTHKCSTRLNIFLGFGDNIFFIKEFYLSKYMLLLTNQPIWNGTLYNKRLWNLSRWHHSGTSVGASPSTPRLLNCRGFSNLLSCLLESGPPKLPTILCWLLILSAGLLGSVLFALRFRDLETGSSRPEP